MCLDGDLMFSTSSSHMLLSNKLQCQLPDPEPFILTRWRPSAGNERGLCQRCSSPLVQDSAYNSMQGNDLWSKTSNWKKRMGKVWKKPDTNFHESSPCGVAQDVYNVPNTSCDNIDVIYQGSSSKPRSPGGFIRGHGLNTYWVAPSKIPDIQKESSYLG